MDTINKVLFLLLFPITVFANEPIKIAIIDTGFDFKSTWSNLDNVNKIIADRHFILRKDLEVQKLPLSKPVLCKNGHKDFVNKKSALPQDTQGHGTHIAGLVASYAQNSNYCLIIIKYWSKSATGKTNLENSIKAFQWALDQKVDVVNYSGGGAESSIEEKNIVKKMIKSGIHIIAAAGNENTSIDRQPYYPGSYKGVLSVGALNIHKKRVPSSNWGKKVVYERGERVISLCIGNKACYMTGTSQATAIMTGKMVKFLDTIRKSKKRGIITKKGLNATPSVN